MAVYKGPVVFAHPHADDQPAVNELGDQNQGCHYPVGEDGHADFSRPLFWDAEAGHYRDKTDEDPSHMDAYHRNHVELDLGGETVRVPDDEAAAVKEFLASRRADQ